jgi:hypothetical protein
MVYASPCGRLAASSKIAFTSCPAFPSPAGKEVLGLWIEETEGACFWLKISAI